MGSRHFPIAYTKEVPGFFSLWVRQKVLSPLFFITQTHSEDGEKNLNFAIAKGEWLHSREKQLCCFTVLLLFPVRVNC